MSVDVETFPPADDFWDDNVYVVYMSDKTRGLGDKGVVLTIDQYDGTGPDDPRCRIAHGGDCCCRTRGHNGPHVSCSMELAAMGFHIVARTAPQ